MRSGPIDLDFDPNQLFQQGINLLNQEFSEEMHHFVWLSSMRFAMITQLILI